MNVGEQERCSYCRTADNHPNKRTRRIAPFSLLAVAVVVTASLLSSWKNQSRIQQVSRQERRGDSVAKKENRNAIVAWIESEAISVVQPTDTVLVMPPAPGPRGRPVISSIIGYRWRDVDIWPPHQFDLPIYQLLDRSKDDFWIYILDELLMSRLPLLLLHGRGCFDSLPGQPSSERGVGDMCPRLLKSFVETVERAGVEDVIRVGMWDDTGMYPTARNHALKTTGPFDVGDEQNWKFFWDHNIKIWFDTVPAKLWYRMEDGKPIIASWHLSSPEFINQEGNASRLLAWLKANFRSRYGVDPFFLLEHRWMEFDTTISTELAGGKHRWFNPLENTYTYVKYNNATWGTVVPSFRDPRTVPGCGVACREQTRRDGRTLEEGLSAGESANVIMLEGWTNMIESSGFYRSNEWSYPSEYIQTVRRYTDPEPETLKFEAEGADRFYDTTMENLGGEYSNRSLDVGRLADNTGWFVGWTEPGEWIEYQNVQLGCGRYRFTARVSMAPNTASPLGEKSLHLEVSGLVSNSVRVPETFGVFQLLHVAELHLPHEGRFDLRVHFESGNIELDWFFVKRVSAAC